MRTVRCCGGPTNQPLEKITTRNLAGMTSASPPLMVFALLATECLSSRYLGYAHFVYLLLPLFWCFFGWHHAIWTVNLHNHDLTTIIAAVLPIERRLPDIRPK